MRLEGLTAVQLHMVEKLWALESEQQAREFIDGLPARYRRVAQQMALMLIYQSIDQSVNTQADCELAGLLLEGYRL
jgi:hypothetical protein